MPKINQEEYEVLKKIRKNGFEEIRRNSTGDIAVRGIGEKVTSHQYQAEHNDKFKFMEATGDYWSIAELIEEYENNRVDEMLERMNIPTSVIEDVSESEEKEVKNIEWLNNEVEKRIEKIKTDEMSFVGSDFFDEGYIHGMKDVQAIANQLDDPEVLSQELPAIPKFVAEWIEKAKKYHSISWLLNYENIKGWSHELTLWCFRSGNDDNLHKLARAWLDGYTVEEEPLYRARLKVITDEFIASYLRTQSSDAEDRLKALEIGSKYIHEDYRHLSEFTEDELKRLDIWDSEQWEVEELEE